MNQISRTILLILAAIGSCLILCLALAPLYGDRMPQVITVENRSRSAISIELEATSDQNTSKEVYAVLRGESATMRLCYDETNIRSRISVIRHLGKGKVARFHFEHDDIRGYLQLVFTDANKLEKREWNEVLPLVVSDKQRPKQR